MADIKITALTALAVAPDPLDVIAIVDVSDLSQAPSGTTKHITIADLAFLSNGANISLLTNDSGYITSADFSNGGELATADRDLGNTDAFGLSFITSGVGRINIEAGGDVGIGNSTPSEKLEVTGTILADGIFKSTQGGLTSELNQNTGTLAQPILKLVGNTDTQTGLVINTTQTSATTSSGGGININGTFASNSTTHFGVKSTIASASLGQTPANFWAVLGGATSFSQGFRAEMPATTVTVPAFGYAGVFVKMNSAATTHVGVHIDSLAGGRALWLQNGNAGLGVLPSATNRLSVLGTSYFNGDVGIGTSTPSQKLEVAGNVKMVDGNQGAGKVLVSDAGGVGSWGVGGGIYAGSGSLSGNTTITTTNLSLAYTTSGQANLFKINGSSNRIGIGTATPNARFEIITASGVDEKAILASTSFDGTTTIARFFTTDTPIVNGQSLEVEFGQGTTQVDAKISQTYFGSNERGFRFFGSTGATPDATAMLTLRGGTNQYVGIGTETPMAKLDVAGNALVNGKLTVAMTGAGTTTTGINVTNDGAARVQIFSVDLYGGYQRLIKENGSSIGWEMAAEGTPSYINTGQNFGINTANPSSALQVELLGAASWLNDGINVTRSNINQIKLSAHSLYGGIFRVNKINGNTAIDLVGEGTPSYIDTGQNFGIGTITPADKIDVVGAARVSTHYKVGLNQVVGARGVGVADATDAATAISQLNLVISRLEAHGLIATI